MHSIIKTIVSRSAQHGEQALHCCLHVAARGLQGLDVYGLVCESHSLELLQLGLVELFGVRCA